LRRSNMAKSMIAVVGANGFIGSRVVEALLERGVSVRGSVRDEAEPVEHILALGLESIVYADLSDAAALARVVCGCSAVVVAAAPNVTTTANRGDGAQNAKLQSTSSAAIVVAASEAGVERVIFLGSATAVASEPREAVYTEATSRRSRFPRIVARTC